MKSKNVTNRITVATIKRHDVDMDYCDELDSLNSQISKMIAVHKMYIGTPDMIIYHLERAQEYIMRNKRDVLKRVHLDED